VVPDALLWAAAASLGDWRTPGGRTYGWDDAPPVTVSATGRAVTACSVDVAEASMGWEVGWEGEGVEVVRSVVRSVRS
jgi:hypothetical protein